MKSFLLSVFLLLSALAALAQGSLEVVPLQHRSAEQVMPILRPLLDPGAALTGQGYQLFIRTSPANLRALRQALAAIDTPKKRLLISVRYGANAEAARSGIETRGTLRSGDVTLSNQRFPAERTQVETRVISSRSASDERVDQRVQALEGSRAFISPGQSRPLQRQQVAVEAAHHVQHLQAWQLGCGRRAEDLGRVAVVQRAAAAGLHRLPFVAGRGAGSREPAMHSPSP